MTIIHLPRRISSYNISYITHILSKIIPVKMNLDFTLVRLRTGVNSGATTSFREYLNPLYKPYFPPTIFNGRVRLQPVAHTSTCWSRRRRLRISIATTQRVWKRPASLGGSSRTPAGCTTNWSRPSRTWRWSRRR